MVRPSVLWEFYRMRLRVHRGQELLAAVGVMAGVALFFSVQVSNGSVTGSATQILHAITGSASLQLAARSPDGFDARTFQTVRALPGVAAAAPLLEQRAQITYGGRRVGVELVGIDASLTSLGGIATDGFELSGLFLSPKPSIMLPSAIAERLRLPPRAPGAPPSQVRLAVRERTSTVSVGAVVGSRQIGALSNALLAAASLPYAQQLVGLPDRVTRVLVVPKPGQEQTVRAALDAIAGDRITVSSITSETHLLAQATAPNDQATNLFAWIGAIVALLFTFNAMLLTMPERRRAVAELRLIGCETPQLVQILGFQALLLGAVASTAGLLIGDFVSLHTTREPPGYLALAFPLGLQRVVDPTTVIVAFTAGVLVTIIATAVPLLADLRRDRPLDAIYQEEAGEPGNALTARARWALLIAAAVLVAATSVLLFLLPSATIYGVGALAAATLLAIPAIFLVVLKIGNAPLNWRPLNTLMFALQALQATKLRSLALAATGAVAIFGSIAVDAARDNLLHGLYRDYREYVSSADIWVAHPDDDLALEPFDDRGTSQTIRAVPGVAAVRPYYGGLLDVAGRRAWILARPATDQPIIPPSQIIDGDLPLATARLRAGGWATVSKQIADKQHLHVGDTITLPTPTGPARLRIAATTTNLGWGPGALILNSRDYRRAWQSDSPTAFEVQTDPRADPVATRRAIQDALGPNSALRAQTTAERATHANALARAGLDRLRQIATLLLLAAAFAMAAATGTAIWQRRTALAQMQIEGGEHPQLWRSLLIETTLVLLVGCLAGALAGTYGHFLLDRWLQQTTGYPAPFVAAGAQTVLTCLQVAAAAFAAAGAIGYIAARAPTRLALTTDN